MDHMKTKWILVWMVHVRVSACCARGSLLPCLLPAQYPHKMGSRCGEATACDGVVCISSWDGCQAKEHFFLSIGHVSLAICSFLSSFWIVFLSIFIFHLLVEKDSYIFTADTVHAAERLSIEKLWRVPLKLFIPLLFFHALFDQNTHETDR